MENDRGRKVLVISGNKKISQDIVSSIKKKCGCEVASFPDGEIALKTLEDQPWGFDVSVVYDDFSEKPDGLELLKSIKSNFNEIEVIFIAKSNERLSIEAWESDAFNCFFYPVNVEGIAYATKYAREQAKFRRERKMLEKLQELSLVINSVTELNEIQKLACQAAVEIFKADHSGLVLFEKNLLRGVMVAEFPPQGKLEVTIEVKGIPLEEDLVHKKKVINISDINKTSGFGNAKTLFENFNIYSTLIVPVELNKKVIASLSLDIIGKKRIFYFDEIELFKKLANQVAIAIGNARYLKELHVLNKIAQYSSRVTPVESELKKLFVPIRKHAAKLLDVKNFYIALYDKVKNNYTFVYHTDELDKLEVIPEHKWKKGLTAYVHNLKKAIRVNSDEIRNLNDSGRIELVGALPKIWLGAPLIASNKVLGVLAVQNYQNESAYDDHDLTVLETVASQIAITIENYQSFQNRIRDIEIVNNIVQVISTKLDKQTLLRTMVTQIKEKLNCTHCTIFLPENRNGKMLLVPSTTHGEGANQILTRTFELDAGLAGRAFQSGESILTPDARNEPGYQKARRRKELPHSMLVAPLKVGERVIGVISADQDSFDWFSKSDQRLIDTLSQHVGIAIERATGLDLLLKVGIELLSSKEEDEVLQIIVSEAIKLTNTTFGVLYLINSSDKQLAISKKFVYPSDFIHPPPRIDNPDSFTRYIYDNRELLTISDVVDDKRLNPKLSKSLRAMIGAPLIIEDKVVGVLYLHDKNVRNFTETEKTFIKALTNQAASAIHNSRFIRQSKVQLRELEALHSTFKEILSRTMELPLLLQAILENATRLCQGKAAQILFLDEVSQKIKVVFTYNIDDLKGQHFKMGEGLASMVIKDRKAHYSNDYHNAKYRAEIFAEPKYKKLFKSIAEAPLLWRNKVLGVLVISSDHLFTPKIVERLEAFARLASIPIAIAREISFSKTLFNNNPDATISITPTGKIKDVNEGALRILEHQEKDELIGTLASKSLWWKKDNISPLEIPSFGNENKFPIRRAETYVKSKNGQKIPVLLSADLLHDDLGENLGWITVLEDQRLVALQGRTKKFFHAIEEINRIEELQKLLNIILLRTIDLLDADSGIFFLKRGDNFSMVSKHCRICDKPLINTNIHQEIQSNMFEKFLMDSKPRSFPKSSLIPIVPVFEEMNSFLVLPLKIENRIIGTIIFESLEQDSFGKIENELLKLLSAEAALAINRAQLKEESEELLLLKGIGDQIRKKGEFSKYKEEIVRISQRLLRSEISTIFLYEKSNRSLVREIWYPKFSNLFSLREVYCSNKDRKGITGRILESQEEDYVLYSEEEKILADSVPEYLDKYKNLPSWDLVRKRSAKSPIKNLLVVPILGEKGKVFGALRVMNKMSKEYECENPILDTIGFRIPEDLKLLKTIASLLSQALSSERRAQKLKTLREITDKISGKEEIKAIGDCLAEAVVNKLNYSACTMRLAKGNDLELISSYGIKSNEKLIALTVNKQHGLVGRALNKNRPAVAKDIFSDNEEINGGYFNKEFAKEEGIRSACCVPIKGLRGEALGVIIVYMKQAPYYFTSYEVYDNFSAIAATCAITIRKVQLANHLKELVDLIELLYLAHSKEEVLDVCSKEMLTIFEANALLVFNIERIHREEQISRKNLKVKLLYKKNLNKNFELPEELIQDILGGRPCIYSREQFPEMWCSLKDRFSQFFTFSLDSHGEIGGVTILFSKRSAPFSLSDDDFINLVTAVSRQLSNAFRNIDIEETNFRLNKIVPIITSAHLASGVIHELCHEANTGKAAITSIRCSHEYDDFSERMQLELGIAENAITIVKNFAEKILKAKDAASEAVYLNLEHCSINKLVDDTLFSLNNEIRDKSAIIVRNYESKLDKSHGYFDRLLLKHVIRNLILNSLKWIDRYGNIKITSKTDGGNVILEVEDDGSGIASSIKDNIFDPHVSGSEGGFGLGLFIVDYIITQKHKGEVEVVSSSNPTCFRIKISNDLRRGGMLENESNSSSSR